VVLAEYLSHYIIGDTFSLVELCEYALCKGLLDCFKVYLLEPCEDAVFPESVSEETVQMRVMV
jgi:hypothetical protein